MTHSDSSAATDPSTPLRARRQMLLLVLGMLALVIVSGGVWALGRNGPATPPPATGVQQMDDHSVTAHGDSQAHAAAPSAVDPHMNMDHAQDDHPEGEVQVEPSSHGHDAPATHTDALASAHGDETAAAHGEPQAAHEAGGHGVEAADVSAPTKQMVLGGFAGVNALTIVAAGILRRRKSPRLPKHLQR